MAATQPDRNWKGIIIAVLVIASVCALIVTSVVLLTPPDEGPRVKGKRLELQDIFNPDLQPYHLNGTWINGKFPYISLIHLYVSLYKMLKPFWVYCVSR